jgi:hypothetical protein
MFRSDCRAIERGGYWERVVRAGALAAILLARAVIASASDDIVVADRALVRVHPERWEGTADLSFSARVSAADGILHVDVDVTDDRVVWDGPNTDHVEVSIADATLVADGGPARGAVDEQRREIETALAAEPRDPALVREVTAGLTDAVQRWRDDERTMAATVVSSARTPAAAPASSRYAMTPHGYRATLAIPLAGILSPTTGSVAAIRYLIEVSDVDRDDATEAETVMASSAPVDAEMVPSRFASLPLPRPWRLRLDREQRIARELAPGGRFELRDGAYAYVLPSFDNTGWSFDGACCTPNIALPGPWQPFQPQDVSRLAGTRLYVGDAAVLFIAGGHRARLNLAAAEPLFQARRGGAYYLVFVENDPSRPGSPMSMCGAGTEDSVVWIQLSAALVEQRRESILINSCWYSMENDLHSRATRLWGETDLVDTRTGNHTARIAYAYDNRRPHRGLVTTARASP